MRGLYHSYTITSQYYLTRSIISAINTFNKLDVVVELNIAAEPAIELVDAIIVAECYIGSTAFNITNYCQ